MSTSTSHKTTISPVFASKICTSLHHTLNYLSRVALCYMIQSTCVLPFQLQGSNNFNEDGIKRSLTLLFLYGYDTVGFACARPQIIISISHSDHLISLIYRVCRCLTTVQMLEKHAALWKIKMIDQ